MGRDLEVRRGRLGAEESSTATADARWWVSTEPKWGLGTAEQLELASEDVHGMCAARPRTSPLLADDCSTADSSFERNIVAKPASRNLLESLRIKREAGRNERSCRI